MVLEDELKCIETHGYALDLEEAEVGLNCLAIPLRQEGRVVAALGVSGPAQRLTKAVLKKLASAIMVEIFDIIKLR